MKRTLPNNYFSEHLQIQMFYDGLTLQSRAQIDSSAGGSLHTKTVEETQDLIELVANNQYLYSTPSERGTVKKGVMEAEAIDTLQQTRKCATGSMQIHKLDSVICVEFMATLVKHVQQFWRNNHLNKLITWAMLQDSPTLILIQTHTILVGGIIRILDGEDKGISSSKGINSIKATSNTTTISSNLILLLYNQILQSNPPSWN
ncbi:hypothetical protein PIB30_032901 [Stylosanthes scabra]|uniref:Uncharacterized protein n=1 Tax=Stylosanthes scabra TaxID=79078 RepID=A0ABU6UE54_9FABA|nr:hypothetical protein [Stylosanthes scabra]